jgi:hypothetical protein
LRTRDEFKVSNNNDGAIEGSDLPFEEDWDEFVFDNNIYRVLFLDSDRESKTKRLPTRFYMV